MLSGGGRADPSSRVVLPNENVSECDQSLMVTLDTYKV